MRCALTDAEAALVVDAAIAAGRSGPGVLLGTVSRILAARSAAATAQVDALLAEHHYWTGPSPLGTALVTELRALIDRGAL